MFHSLIEQYKNRIISIFTPCFIFMFIISGIYEIPFTSIDPTLITKAKQALFLLFIVLMSLALDWGKAIRTRFAILCAAWLIILILNWILRYEYEIIYLQRIAQITYIFVFVSLVIQLKNERYTFLNLLSLYSPKVVSGICLILLFSSYTPEIAHALAYGFGNNRVNFSIWLSQLVFLTFLVGTKYSKKPIVYSLILVLPIIALQTFSGGRTGILCSILISIYFSYRAQGIKFCIPTAILLALFIWACSLLSTVSSIYPGTDVLRGLYYVNNETLFSYIDRISSYRLSIMIGGLSNLNNESLILGFGASNFKTWVLGSYMNMHNIYLRALGELGIIGFGVQLLLLAIPHYGHLKKNSIEQAARLFCMIFLFIGLLHPDLLLTAISTCMIYWLCYAEVYYARKVYN